MLARLPVEVALVLQTIAMVVSRRAEAPDWVRWTVRRNWFSVKEGSRDRVVASGQFNCPADPRDPLLACKAALRFALADLEAGEGEGSGRLGGEAT